MATARKSPPAPFRPVVRFPVETTADRVAERLTWALHGVVVSTMNTERNQQVKIGLSEIGTDCMRCLARKLSMEYHDSSSGWKAMVGTFVHAGLEDHMRREYQADTSADADPAQQQKVLAAVADFAKQLGAADVRFHLEETVTLREFPGWDSLAGSWPGFMLDGHCDLMVEVTLPDGEVICIVVDWKCLGERSLKEKQRGHLGSTYAHQLPAYGLGWTLRGYNVTHVLLAGVPRDGEIHDAAFVLDRYDPQPVIQRLALIENMIDTARLIGWEKVIQAQPRPGHCFDCKRFEASEERSLLDAFR